MLYDAALEIVEERMARTFIDEIGEGIGYAKSELYFLSEVTYKKYKRLIMDCMAKKLHLTD